VLHHAFVTEPSSLSPLGEKRNASGDAGSELTPGGVLAY
jgi:hypothetical protein